jgi:hypothetical protein
MFNNKKGSDMNKKEFLAQKMSIRASEVNYYLPF